MNITNCPVCFDELEVIETTPCMVCGHDKDKVSLLKQDIAEKFQHDSFTFSTFRSFEKIECNLCDFCSLEFTSMDPEFFGFEKGKVMWPENFQFLTHIARPSVEYDKFCTQCNMRLSFIKFTKLLRELNNA
ncbi:MAG: hypothetical protein ACRBEE_00830 [Arenicella sp.]